MITLGIASGAVGVTANSAYSTGFIFSLSVTELGKGGSFTIGSGTDTSAILIIDMIIVFIYLY